MRWLFILMTVTFLFNGLDAGKHVFGATIAKQEATKMAGMDCCPDSKKENKSAATACDYCCAGLLALVSPVIVKVIELPEERVLPLIGSLISEPQDTLFRPPRLA